MVNMQNYRKLVDVLNSSSHLKGTDHATIDQLIMVTVFDKRAMSPSDAKQTISDLIKEGIMQKKGDFVVYNRLYDPSKKAYVIKSPKTGKTLKSKVKKGISRRTVRYAAPGRTIVGYEHRTLEITFPETEKEFKNRQKARRRTAARNRTVDDTIYVDRNENGMVLINKRGKESSSKARSRSDKGRNVMIKKNIARDRYTIEDMRAMLSDDHWEEVCGNRRWNYDKASTVREFNKYLKQRRN